MHATISEKRASDARTISACALRLMYAGTKPSALTPRRWRRALTISVMRDSSRWSTRRCVRSRHPDNRLTCVRPTAMDR